ncbi:hypothetical protein [Enterobacter asburiae]|uniref:hypothetical protein n=1 Tax=Enterobacter asburiae TaxID=61645 RepID=UPI003BD35966
MSNYWDDRIGIVINSIMAAIAGVLVTLLLLKPAPTKSTTPEPIACIQIDKKALIALENGNDIEKSQTSNESDALIFLFRSQK